MEGYYDAAPQRIPRIPIAVCGFFGSGHERVGTMVGTLTGLQTSHVTELVEHETGRAVPRGSHPFGALRPLVVVTRPPPPR